MTEDIQTSPDFICKCGVPLKVYREHGTAWIGCVVCGREVHFEELDDFEKLARTLKAYWRKHGAPAVIDL